LDASKIYHFLGELGCEKISAGSRWIRSTCPLQHRHSDGKDKQPSFAICVDLEGESRCRCQACGLYGPLLPFIWRLKVEKGQSRPDLFKYLVQYNQLDTEKLLGDTPTEGEVKDRESLSHKLASSGEYIPQLVPKRDFSAGVKEEPQAEVPEDVLKSLVERMNPKVMDFLTRHDDPATGVKGRGLDKMTVIEWEFGWHPLQRRIAIPIRDENGVLVALSGRSFEEDGPVKGPKYLHSRFKRDRVLFGEGKRDPKVRVGYLFEGFFQAIYTWQCGYRNVYSRMGTHLSPQQQRKLVKWCDKLVIVPDGDTPGIKAAERDAETLKYLEFKEEDGTLSKITDISIVSIPKGKDIDNLTPAHVQDLLGSPNVS